MSENEYKGKIYLPVSDNFDENRYLDRYKVYLNPNEYLSEKIKRYDRNLAMRYEDEDLPQYQIALAMARLSFKDNLSVYKFKKEIIEKIQDTKIDNMPNEIPLLLTKPFVIESTNSNEALFGDVISIIGFFSPINDDLIKMYKENPDELPERVKEDLKWMKVDSGNNSLFSIIFQTRNHVENDIWQRSALNLNNVTKTKSDVSIHYYGQNMFLWIPNLGKAKWDFIKIDYNREVIMAKNYCRICSHSNVCDKLDRWSVGEQHNFCFEGVCDNILSFITIFNYMLQVENLVEFDKKNEIINRTHRNKKNKVITKEEEWIIKYLYINKSKIKYEENKEHEKLIKDGYKQKEIRVKGHLRYQAYGTNHSLRKWIYIESFISTKWTKDGDTKIIVNYK